MEQDMQAAVNVLQQFGMKATGPSGADFQAYNNSVQFLVTALNGLNTEAKEAKAEVEELKKQLEELPTLEEG